jgi:hypothetical protein
MTANRTIIEQATTNHRRRKQKESESKIDSDAHNQTFKLQKQLNDRNHHIPININTDISGLNSPIKRHHLATGLKRKIQQSVACRKPISSTETSTGLG